MNDQFSVLQKELVDSFLTTRTKAKVLRRKVRPEGGYEFYEFVRETSPIDFPINDEEFAIKVHEKNPNAPLSPIYVNMRNLPEELIQKIAKVLSEVQLEKKPNFCTGIPNTAVLFAKAYSRVSGIPFVDIYEKSGTNTSRKLIAKENAPSGKGKSILIIDDVISQGNSKFEALEVVEELGYKVSGVFVLIDRSQGGSRKLEKMKYKLYSVFTLPKILDYYLSENKISKDKYSKIISYLTSS